MRCAAPLAILVLCAGTALAQQPITAAQVTAQLIKFKAERGRVAKDFSAAEATVGDEAAAKAEELLAAGKLSQAAALVQEARWTLPEQPRDLPPHILRTLGASRLRHGDFVNCLRYSPDAETLVSSSRDGTVRVWDVGSGRELLTYRGHETEKFTEDTAGITAAAERVNLKRVPAVAISPDGKTVASAGGVEIHLWELATGKQIRVLKDHKAEAYALAFHPTDNAILLSGGSDKKFTLWDTAAKKVLHTSEELTGNVSSVAFSPDGKWVAAGDDTGSAVVFERGKWGRPAFGGKLTDLTAINSLQFGNDGVNMLAAGKGKAAQLVVGPGGSEATVGSKVRSFGSISAESFSGNIVASGITPDGKLAVTLADIERTVLLWDMDTGKQIRVYPGDPSVREAICLAIRPDGKQIAVGYKTGIIRLYSITNADEHRSFTESKDNIWTTCFSPDGKRFATGGADKVLRIYAADTGVLVKELLGHTLAITTAVFLGNDRIASVGGDRVVKVWDIAAGTANDGVGHTVAILGLAANSKNTRLVSASADRSIRGWDAATAKELWKSDTRSAACCVAFTKDDAQLLLGTADGRLHLYQFGESGATLLSEVPAHSGGVAALAVNAAGYIVTGGGDGVVKSWNLGSKGELTEIKQYLPPFKAEAGVALPITAVGFAPDGKQVFGAGAEGVVRLWDLTTGGEVRPLRGHTGWVTSANFSPDGKTVLSGSVDKTARLFDLPRADTTPTGHLDGITAIAVSPDGTRVATGGGDRYVKIWDAKTAKELLTLIPEAKSLANDSVWSMAFLGADRLVVCTSKLITVWNLTTGKAISSSKQPFDGISVATGDGGKSYAAAGIIVNSRKNVGNFHQVPATGEPVNIEVKPTTDAESVNSATVSLDAVWGVLARVDGTVQIWDVATKKKVGDDWKLQKDAVVDLGFTQDRKTLIALSEKGEVRIADVAKRSVTRTFQAMTGDPLGLVVSPVGERFITMTGDAEVKAWDFAGKELRSWKLPVKPTSAVFSADGGRVLTGNGNGSALILEMPK